MLSPRSTSIVKFAFNSKDRTEIKSGLIVMILNFMGLFLKRIPKLKNYKSVRTLHLIMILAHFPVVSVYTQACFTLIFFIN